MSVLHRFPCVPVVVKRLLTMLSCYRLDFDKRGINVETQGRWGEEVRGEEENAKARRRKDAEKKKKKGRWMKGTRKG